MKLDFFDPIKEEMEDVMTTDKGSGNTYGKERSYGSEHLLTSHKSGDSKLYDIEKLSKYEKLSFFRKQSHNLSSNGYNMSLHEVEEKPRIDYLLNIISEDEND